MSTAVRNQTGVPADLRELMILRVAVLNGADFEIEAHVPHAQKAGVSDAKIAATRSADLGPLFKPRATRKSKPVAAVKPVRRAAATRPPPSVAEGPEDIRDAVNRLKRERIIATAVELFYNQGLSNTTLEEVAERLNVTRPFIHSHFRSKADLLAEICSRGIRASLDALDRVLATEGSATEKLQLLAREFTLAVLNNQAHIAIYNREEKHLSPEDGEAINIMRHEFDRKFCALLSEGVEAGEFVVADVPICSLAIGGIVSWSYVWHRPNGRLTQAQTADRISDLGLAMVNAKPVRRKTVRGAAASPA